MTKTLKEIKRLISNNAFKLGYGNTEQKASIIIKIGIRDRGYEISNKTADELETISAPHEDNRFWRVLL
jgi:hypothetical protein